jgi:hypothetical protein
VIAVTENETSMQVSVDQLPLQYRNQFLIARSYAEAAGMLGAHKHGILLDSLTSQIPKLKVERL